MISRGLWNEIILENKDEDNGREEGKSGLVSCQEQE